MYYTITKSIDRGGEIMYMNNKWRKSLVVGITLLFGVSILLGVNGEISQKIENDIY